MPKRKTAEAANEELEKSDNDRNFTLHHPAENNEKNYYKY